ncbi:MAG: formylglycine-generating enzyme family protein, partial [Deltaproteobacteria bacterium]|nr:formylglycine-generating enzyme family protein [Deltaproteobacteria bacterium]
MRLLVILLWLAASNVLSGLPAQAAGLQARTQISLEQGYNPNPAPDDFSLPMPCGLSMVFKAVSIPVQGLLWDVNFNMGTETAERDGMEYYDRRFGQNISGPFCAADLPKDWQALLPAEKGAQQAQHYFMGKYEISALQWQAVMDGQCPAQAIEADLLPKSDISWYDAIEFSRRYNTWLLENAAAALPHFHNDPKNIGYVRLPTEAEWEYAARGGSRVPADALRQQEFHALEPGATLEDYAVFRPENAGRILDAPQRIGSRRPNPLGLYDMAGNVAEMMLETFHFSLGNRLHGSAGGVVRKGGGFNASRDEIMPGRREEIPLLHARGLTLTRDTGARLVLSGVNTPDGGRTEALKREWAALGERSEQIVPGANPLQELDRILGLTQDAATKANLTTLRGVIKDFNTALEREQSTTAEGLMRTAVYMMETIRNYAVRLNISKDRIKENEELAKKERGEVLKKRQAMIQQYVAGADSFVDAIQASL